MMLHILNRVSGSAIVYCRSRDLCQVISKYIKQHGISATYFHAGLTHTERELRQNRWMSGEIRVMVATNAFGMGIDKPDVRLVIHLNMPSSLEEYFQEAGRAGRDGKKSYAVMITGRSDIQTLKRRFTDAFPSKEYIFQVYDSVCNYLKIGEGEGFQRSYDFDTDFFLRTFRMHPIQTISAIEIMQVAGWLDYHRDDTRSRLMILYTREELYADHVGHDKLFRTLLRLYTGLFADYVFISETDISAQLGVDAEEVYTMLTHLTHIGVLHYIPKKQIPRLYFHIRREDTSLLKMPQSAYEERRDRLGERIKASIQYIQTDNVCRSRLLLNYFGEEEASPCGLCDVCLQRNDEGLQNHIVERTEEMYYTLIARSKGNPITVSDIVGELPHTSNDTILALRYLAQTRNLFRLEGEYIVPRVAN